MVTGNFCDAAAPYAAECDTVSPRMFEVCDKVGNCTIQDIDIHWYDPVEPQKPEVVVFNQSISATPMKITSPSTLGVQLQIRLDGGAVIAGSDFDTEVATIATDANTCGTDLNDPFSLETGNCSARTESCVFNTTDYTQRGEAVNAGGCALTTTFDASGVCGEGYAWNATTAVCDPTCSNLRFLPNLCFSPTTGLFRLSGN